MAKQGGYGVKLKVTVSAALTVVAGVTDVEYPKFTREVDDITAHDSPSGFAEYLSTGLKMLGSFKASLVWDKANTTHAALTTAYNSGAALAMSIEDAGGAEIIAFSGIVKELGRVGKQKAAFTCDVVIQPTGAPTITP